MSDFQTYLTLGFQHIIDLNGYDHILFIIALCAAYRLKYWRNITVLVTAFTIGHSLTLLLSTTGIIFIPSPIIEFLIPVTIFLTCVLNIVDRNEIKSHRHFRLNYGIALCFGLIHGMGFSNYLRMLLGREESIMQPLFAFNAGLELGQLLIVSSIMTVLFLVQRVFKIRHRAWTLTISGIAAGISLILMNQTKFW